MRTTALLLGLSVAAALTTGCGAGTPAAAGGPGQSAAAGAQPVAAPAGTVLLTLPGRANSMDGGTLLTVDKRDPGRSSSYRYTATVTKLPYGPTPFQADVTEDTVGPVTDVKDLNVDRDGNVVVHGKYSASALDDPDYAFITLDPTLTNVLAQAPEPADDAPDGCTGVPEEQSRITIGSTDCLLKFENGSATYQRDGKVLWHLDDLGGEVQDTSSNRLLISAERGSIVRDSETGRIVADLPGLESDDDSTVSAGYLTTEQCTNTSNDTGCTTTVYAAG